MRLPDLFPIVICVFQLVSTIGIFKLLAYTIFRYRTNERGGIHTGFASAAIVMVISGMCCYCTLSTIETFLYLSSQNYYNLMTKSGTMVILQNLAYLFTICWTNTISLVITINAVSMKEPKKNNSRNSFGFCNIQFYKWLTYPVITKVCYAITTIAFNISCKARDITNEKSMIFQHSGPIFYSEIIFFLISGICIIINIISLSIFAFYMRKSYLKRKNKVSVWKKLPRPLKSSIKVCFIMSFMWKIHLIYWIIDVAVEKPEIQSVSLPSLASKSFQILYSLQGLILFCVVFFYRSKQDRNPVIAVVNRSLARSADDNLNIINMKIFKDHPHGEETIDV